MQTIEFYQGHLDRVSRSFAFCIQKLDPPFRQWISLSYLLCRALDTVEDAPWKERAIQDGQFDRFEDFLDREPSIDELRAWSSRFPERIPDGERALLDDAHLLFGDLHALPPKAKQVIQIAVGKMRRGMQHYSHRSKNGVLKLDDLADVNRYCYFVAGVVGELLSGLYVEFRPAFKPSADFSKNALHFGLFLQKINLLKDQRTDEREGRFLVPDRATVLSSLKANAIGALNYLLELPESEKGFRTFCGWSLFLGAASIPWMEQSYSAQDESKIPRSVTQELLAAVAEVVQDNTALKSELEEYLELLPSPQGDVRTHTPLAEVLRFQDLSGGAVGPEEMRELGMVA